MHLSPCCSAVTSAFVGFELVESCADACGFGDFRVSSALLTRPLNRWCGGYGIAWKSGRAQDLSKNGLVAAYMRK